jgi:hypothetical protein
MSASSSSGSALTREAIRRALSSLSEELGKQGITGEVCLFDGSVMVLAFTARVSTKDADAIFRPTRFPAPNVAPPANSSAEAPFANSARRLS